MECEEDKLFITPVLHRHIQCYFPDCFYKGGSNHLVIFFVVLASCCDR